MDDIVTRLLELAKKQDAQWPDPTDAPLTMYQVAVDEIELLRTSNETLKALVIELQSALHDTQTELGRVERASRNV